MMKQLFILIMSWSISFPLSAQQISIRGHVYQLGSGVPLVQVTVKSIPSGRLARTDEQGAFSLNVPSNDTLVFTNIGFEGKKMAIADFLKGSGNVYLKESIGQLAEAVVNTGYYTVPKERATGSFDFVDSALLNRTISTDIISRLEGVTSSLYFNRQNFSGETSSTPDLRVRGLSTISSESSPLIVLDNFPYAGDISTINPNDIESITVLKDAAASSIWGARAGNGVIVLTTKSGKYGQATKVNMISNLTLGSRPDLDYNPNWLPASAVMEIEEKLFDQGSYAEQPQTMLPAYVELLIKRRDGDIGTDAFAAERSRMEATDIRKEASRLLYQNSFNQQYAFNVNGGGQAYTYYMSLGYDKNRSPVKGNNNSRINLNMQNTFRPIKQLELTAGIWYSQQKASHNGLTLTAISPSGAKVSPYARLADEEGNALPITFDRRFRYEEQAVAEGLLDWHYRPLDELHYADNSTNGTEYRINAGVSYRFLKYFNINGSFQHIRSTGGGQNYYAPETYFVRDLVNRFTQPDGTRIIPYQGILDDAGTSQQRASSGRLQLNYQQTLNADHTLTALAGAEIRQQSNAYFPGFRLYDYDRELLLGNTVFDYTTYYVQRPEGTGSLQIPAPPMNQSRFTDRFLSYYGNAAYTFKQKYTFSGSLRWDGSNLFGVKTNQKGVPLWSAGWSWNLSEERFYHGTWMPYLRLRATYGSSGNVNTSVSAFPTVRYSNDAFTRLPTAVLTSAGNPSLKWERVNIFNLGIDFSSAANRLHGSLEYYMKSARDLIGQDYMDPTTGIVDMVTLPNYINYASMSTRGVDVQLTTINIRRNWNWETTFLVSYVKNNITRFNTNPTNRVFNYMNTPAAPREGKSRDVVYALPWYGLDHETGRTLIYVDGLPSTDYDSYYNNYDPELLLDMGSSVPTFFGSVRNTLGWKNIQLSFLLVWKSGYVFRRSSMLPGAELQGSSTYHMDYLRRWEQPGDERYTDVPAEKDVLDAEANIYGYSEALVTRGDHLRLQDINLNYRLRGNWVKKTPFRQVSLTFYARNLGILWRANKQHLDPDFPNASYPTPKSFALGLQLNL